MGVVAEILDLIRDLDEKFSLPRVDRVYLPPVRIDKRHADFGLVLLDDRSAGLFYIPEQRPVTPLDRGEAESLIGLSAWHLARELTSSDLARRALAFGAASAITQHLFDRAGYELSDAKGVDPVPGDHVGMVGLFPTMVDRFRAQGIRLTVIEKRADLVQTDKNFEITLDPARLNGCNRILCTAATLLNGSIDEILENCRKAEWVSVIGPSAGCPPDPLFTRGVQAVGATRITQPETLLERMQAGAKWRDSITKYTLLRGRYPGFKSLLQRALRRSTNA